MKPELKHLYQAKIHSFYNNHKAAYEVIVKLKNTRDKDACKKIAEDHSLKLDCLRSIHYAIRMLKSIGVPVEPPLPVKKMSRVQKLEQEYRKKLEGFKKKNGECYERLKEIVESGQPLDISTRRQLGKNYGLTPETVKTAFCQIKRFAKWDEERQEDDGEQVEADEEQEEQEDRDSSRAESRPHVSPESPRKPHRTSLVKRLHPMRSLDSSKPGRRHPENDEADFPDSPGSGMLSEPRTRSAGGTSERRSRRDVIGNSGVSRRPEEVRSVSSLDGEQEDGDHEEQEEQMDDDEFEDPHPNEPSTSGPPRTRYEEPAYSEDYQFEESSGRSSKHGIRRIRSSGRRSRKENDAIEYFREPSSSSSKKRTDRQGEGNDWLNLDPRTRSAVGTSERRSRRAKKISVPRAASTKRHRPSGSPDAPEAKRRQLDKTEQLEHPGFREPATSPSPPPEERNPRGDQGSVLVPRQNESSRIVDMIYNNIRVSLEIVDNSLVKSDDNAVSAIGRTLRGQLEEIDRLVKLNTSTEKKRNCKFQEKLNAFKTHFNASQSLLDHLKLDDIEEMSPDLELNLIEQKRDRRRETGSEKAAPVEQAHPGAKVLEITDCTISSVILEPEEAVEPESDVQEAEVSVGEQMDLGTGESMPHVTAEPAIQSVDQQAEDDSTQNVLPESRTQGTVVLEEQPLERADSETQSTMNDEIRVGTVEQQQQDERTRPLLETQPIEEHTRSQVILEPEEAVEPQSIVQGAEVPEETTENAPRSQSTDLPVVLKTEEAAQSPAETVPVVLKVTNPGEHQMDLETQPLEDIQPQEAHDPQDPHQNPNDSLESSPRHPASPSSVKRQCPIGSLDSPTTKQRQLEHEDVSGLEAIFLNIHDAFETLNNALNQLDDNRIKNIGKSLQVDLKKIKRMLESSTIPEDSSRNKRYSVSFAIIQAIKRSFIALGSGISQLTVEDRDEMSNELRLDMSTIGEMLENWNMNRDWKMVVPGADSVQRSVESRPHASSESPRHPSRAPTVKIHYPIGSLDAPTAKRLQPEREDVNSTDETESRVPSETAEHGNPQNDSGASQMEEADVTEPSPSREVMYIDIEDALELLHNVCSQLKDEDISDIGTSLRVNLKKMKRLLEQSTVPGTSSWKRQCLEHSENISDIELCFKSIGYFLSQLPVEDMDEMSTVLELDLSTIRQMIENWNRDAEMIEAIKEEPMEQEQQDGTPEDQPEPQVKQEPEEEPVADPNC